MSHQCGVNGTATVQVVDGRVEWATWNDAIHVSEELRADPVAMLYITQKYHVGEWCPEVNAYHARLHAEDAP